MLVLGAKRYAIILIITNYVCLVESTIRIGSSQRTWARGSPARRRQQQESDRDAALRDQFGMARVGVGSRRTQGCLGVALATLGRPGGAVGAHRDAIECDRGEEQAHRHSGALEAAFA